MCKRPNGDLGSSEAEEFLSSYFPDFPRNLLVDFSQLISCIPDGQKYAAAVKM
jgi:hypothetical protein